METDYKALFEAIDASRRQSPGRPKLISSKAAIDFIASVYASTGSVKLTAKAFNKSPFREVDLVSEMTIRRIINKKAF